MNSGLHHVGTIKLWETDSWRPVQTFEGHSDWVREVTFSPDGQWLLSGAKDGELSVRIWEVASGRPILIFAGLGEVNSVLHLFLCLEWESQHESSLNAYSHVLRLSDSPANPLEIEPLPHLLLNDLAPTLYAIVNRVASSLLH